MNNDDEKDEECDLVSPLPKPGGEITFQNPSGWVMKITDEGIRFNREDNPNLCADEFAQEVIALLGRGLSGTVDHPNPGEC